MTPTIVSLLYRFKIFTEKLLPELRDDGVEDECDEEEDLRDDQEGGGELAGDDLKDSSLLRVTEVTDPRHHPDLAPGLRVLQTILVRPEDMMVKMEAGRGQIELARLVIEDGGVAVRLPVHCQDIGEADIVPDGGSEFIIIFEDTLLVLTR